MNLVKIQLSLLSGFQGRSKASIFRYILASEPVMFVVITPFKKIVQKLSNHKLKRNYKQRQDTQSLTQYLFTFYTNASILEICYAE